MSKKLNRLPKIGIRILGIVLLISVANCSTEPAIDGADTAALPYNEVSTPRFNEESIAAAKMAISNEPKVIDVLFDEGSAIEWHVAVEDDGTRRYGYAQSLCMVLKENGAYDDDVDIRIVDAAKRAQFKDAYREYSLGAVRCKDDQFLD
jgi:hypothetical protein